MCREAYKVCRQQIIDLVLATDMTKHFEYLNQFVELNSIANLHVRQQQTHMFAGLISGWRSPVADAQILNRHENSWVIALESAKEWHNQS